MGLTAARRRAAAVVAGLALAAVGAVTVAGTAGVPAAAGASGPPAGFRAAALSAPSYAGDFPDPDVISVGPTFWAYATGSAGRNLQVMSSTDLHNWTPVTDPLPSLPPWAVFGRTWAPGVVKLGVRYVMYYTVEEATSGRQCLSVAVAAAPGGPFVDSSAAPFVCQLDHGGSIDPSPFLAPDGQLFLVWKSDDNAIGQPTHLWSQPLSGDGLSLQGSPSLLLSETAPWQPPSMEGPAMMAMGGGFALFYSANAWNSPTSAIGWALCTSPLGGCTDESASGPWMASHGPVVAPGGPAPFLDSNGVPMLAFAAWTGPVGYVNGGVRSLWVAPLGATNGYRATAADGGVFTFGDATFLGAASTAHPVRAVTGMATTTGRDGYWQVGTDGGVFTYGGARFFGSTGAIRLAAPVVGMMPSPSDAGYALVARDGGVFAFGDFPFAGSAAGRLPSAAVGGATSALLAGPGYWIASADGTVAAFGAAPPLGSARTLAPHAPIVAIAPSPSGVGYWLVGSDGGVFTFGSAGFYGSLGNVRLAAPIVGMTPSPTGRGYWLVAADGGVFSFGDAAFAGSLGGLHLNAPITGAAGAAWTPVCGC